MERERERGICIFTYIYIYIHTAQARGRKTEGWDRSEMCTWLLTEEHIARIVLWCATCGYNIDASPVSKTYGAGFQEPSSGLLVGVDLPSARPSNTIRKTA